jgi:hypothetical protein
MEWERRAGVVLGHRNLEESDIQAVAEAKDSPEEADTVTSGSDGSFSQKEGSDGGKVTWESEFGTAGVA